MNEQAAMPEGLELQAHHEVVENDEWIEGLREASGNPNLMMYYHHHVGKYVLGVWLEREEEFGRDLVMELEVFEQGHPATTNEWGFETLVARVTPVEEQKSAYRQKVREMREAEALEREADLEAKERARHHALVQGEEAMAEAIRIGAVPIAAPSEALEDLKPSERDVFDLRSGR